jgi:hypothetical protein
VNRTLQASRSSRRIIRLIGEQIRMGVLKNSEPETFVIVTIDSQDQLFIKRTAFPPSRSSGLL